MPPSRLPSIRRLLVLLTLACVLPASLLVCALIMGQYQRERAQVERGAVGTARALAGLMDERLRTLQAELVLLAQSPHLQAGDFAGFHADAATVQQLHGIAVVALVSPTEQVVNSRVPYGTPMPPQLPPAMQEALRTGQPGVSGVFVSPSVGRPVVAVAVPATAGAGKRYSLNGHLEAADFAQVLQRQGLPAGWIAGVIDRDGKVIARTQDHARFTTQPAQPDLVAFMHARGEGVSETPTLEGTEAITAFSRSGHSGWTVAIAIPRDELLAPVRQSLLLALGVAIILLLVTLRLAWQLGQNIGLSIARLAGAARALERGQPVVPPQARFREAHELGEAFAHASTALAAHRAEREQHVDALTRSNLDLQQFAFVASHDLRSPLRSMMGFLHLLHARHAEQLGPKGQDLVNRSLRAGHQMDQLAEDLLRYARLDAEAKPMAPVDCNQVVADAQHMLDAQIRESGAQVTAAVLPTIEGDRTQLVQLFQNLIGNAIKYCQDRTPQVRVDAERGTREWVFHVRDNGIGIAPEHLDRVFEPFKRLHTQKDFTGSGIGLAVCRRIVTRHNGRIWCTSIPGEGSTFSFSVPDNGGYA